MIASLLIVFREVIEAGLIVGIVLAATHGIDGRGRWVAGGIGAGVLGAVLVAVFAGALSAALSGFGQELFQAVILTVAALMLCWHILWMSRHGRELAAEMAATGHAVRSGEKSLPALAVVVAVAVLREGSEIALFLYGIWVSTRDGWGGMLLGGVSGLCLGAVLSYAIFRGLVILPLRSLFRVTNGLIALMAAGMAGQAAAVLVGIDALPSLGEGVWDSSFLIPEDGLAGRTLKALMGYSAAPSGIQILVYAVTLAGLLVLSRLLGRPSRHDPAGAR
ncbi:MAG: iron permease [Telmatospirillum sp.]|nr:iron permease [Telmatospirillum sp.]